MVINFQSDAEKQLKEIHAYYKEKSKSAADKIVKDIRIAVLPLMNFPQMAAIEPLLSDGPTTYRALVVRSIFKVIYFIDEEKEMVVLYKECHKLDIPVIDVKEGNIKGF